VNPFHLLPFRRTAAGALTLPLLAGALLLAGCDSPDPKDVLGISEETSESRSARDCRDNLRNALSSLAPERLEITADFESTVDVLNLWLNDCASTDTISDDELRQIQSFTSEAMGENLVRERFNRRDAGFLRNAILCRRIVDQVARLARDDLERTVKLFEFVVRNVVLTPDTQAVPLTLYEILLFGRGSEAQQAWLFAELLRQLRIDSVLIHGSDSGPGGPEWVFAVILDDHTYLLDFHLQTPVPADSSAEPGAPPVPASLAQALENPEILDALRELGSRVPAAAAIPTAEIRIPAESSHWSARMKALNSQLVGESFLIFDGLLDHEGGDGAVSRVTTFTRKHWETPPRISVWDVPDRQAHEFWEIEPNSSRAQALAVRKEPFKAPIDLHSQQEGSPPRLVPTQLQWTSRLAQLQGKFADAVRTFGLVRQDERKKSLGLSPEEQQIPFVQSFLLTHRTAAQDAHFWVAVSQLDLEDFDEAADTFSDYERRFPGGRWADPLPFLWAKALLLDGARDEARAKLESIGEASVFHKPARFLLQALNAAADDRADDAPSTE
jgi:hypothetical protein